MAEFGTVEAGIRYYLAEGFCVSRCKCPLCGELQIVSHFPTVIRDDGNRDETRAGDFVVMDCGVGDCKGNGLLTIVSRFSIGDFEHGDGFDERID
jgi:hypothetical protein